MLNGLLAIVAAWFAHPASPTLHYRVDISSTWHIERSPTDTSGGDYHATAFLSTSLRDTTRGQIGHVVIDSVTCHGTGLLAEAYDPKVATASKGAWYDVLLDRDMREAVPRPSIRNTLTYAIAQVALELFPPDGMKGKAGDTWSDTLDIKSVTDRWTETSPGVTRWKVTAVSPEGVVLDGDLAIVLGVNGQVAGTGMVVGKRRMMLSPSGVVRSATLSTTTQMLAAGQQSTEIRAPRGTTSATVTLIGDHP